MAEGPTSEASLKRFGGFIITFDRPEILRQTISKVLEQTFSPAYVLVLDNGSNPATQEILGQFAADRVGYHSMGGNLGPAGAAAFGLRRLVELGFDWVWWGDDDDPPRTADTFERLHALATSAESRVGAVAAAGNRWDANTGKVVRPADEELHGVLRLDVFAGNNHPIISSTAVREIGLPDAELFFGYEELEYALRLRAAGYEILADGDLFHRYREAAGRLKLEPRRRTQLSWLGRTSWRQYYSTRNYIHIMRQQRRNDLVFREVIRSLARATASFRGGFDQGSRFTRLQLAAVIDGYLGKLGKQVSPVAKYEMPSSEGPELVKG